MQSEINRHRNAARRLKKAFVNADQEARDRLRVYTKKPDPKHADFLHVIAREAGHESWPKLKFQSETSVLSRDEKTEKLKYALFLGQEWRVRNLLEETPDLAKDRLDIQIATYDLASVEDAIAARPLSATEIIGVRSPILHLAFSRHHKMAPERQSDMMAIAELLVRNGADVNDGYPAPEGAPHMLSALYGALGHADNLVLAERLLEQGATPNDGESLYHSTELDHLDGLKLLARFDVDPVGTNALLRTIDFDDPQKVGLVLELGADPDEAGLPMPALHHAARRWAGVEVAALLLEHGADPARVFEGHTPYATARMHGNSHMAGYLEGLGYAGALSKTQAQFAASAGGGEVGHLDPGDMSADEKEFLVRLAAHPGHLAQIKALVGAGFDPNVVDKTKMTALLQAGWCGFSEYVEYLLTLSPDLEAKSAYGGDILSTIIHGAENCPERAERAHLTCARLVLEAGAKVDQRYVEASGNPELAEYLADWLAGVSS